MHMRSCVRERARVFAKVLAKGAEEKAAAVWMRIEEGEERSCLVGRNFLMSIPIL